jgi:hypothetical protein
MIPIHLDDHQPGPQPTQAGDAGSQRQEHWLQQQQAHLIALSESTPGIRNGSGGGGDGYRGPVSNDEEEKRRAGGGSHDLFPCAVVHLSHHRPPPAR